MACPCSIHAISEYHRWHVILMVKLRTGRSELISRKKRLLRNQRERLEVMVPRSKSDAEEQSRLKKEDHVVTSSGVFRGG